jgi:hypothetical protein
MLDPSCGDGRFLAAHCNSLGIELDGAAIRAAHCKSPTSPIIQSDFFLWAATTEHRFECAAGNPPFIRYQRFNGETRNRALRLCETLGAKFSGLSSSWAPYLVATASLVKPGGRMAFIVPAEIGHAPYAAPLIDYLLRTFRRVQLIAIRKKVFQELSEDAWILLAEDHGFPGGSLVLTAVEDLCDYRDLPPKGLSISRQELEKWGYRVRPLLMPPSAIATYRKCAGLLQTTRLGDVARVSIGYVTGANNFFHLRPTNARKLGIGTEYLHAAVRNGRQLEGHSITRATVARWERNDDQYLLLRIRKGQSLSRPVIKYLDSEEGANASQSYKCRNRRPWYVVPDVFAPDAFMTYMTGRGPELIANTAKCVGTNSLHMVSLNGKMSLRALSTLWESTLRELSAEIEGHPLGGGLLKIEPREAGRIILRTQFRLSDEEQEDLAGGLQELRRWRQGGR